MNMLSAHINFRDVQPSATDWFIFKRNRPRAVAETPYFNMQGWYTETHRPYHDLPIFQELGFLCDAHGNIQLDKKIIQRLNNLWGSPRWPSQVLSFTTWVDGNPANACSTTRIKEVLQACLTHRQPLLLHTAYLPITELHEVLTGLVQHQLIHIVFSIGSSQENWRKQWEPGTKPYTMRLHCMNECSQRGIPCGMLLDPVIPGESLQGLYELMRLVQQVGIQWAAYRLWNSSTPFLKQETSNSKTNEELLKNGFISQFTHYCKQFKLNQQNPDVTLNGTMNKKEYPMLLF